MASLSASAVITGRDPIFARTAKRWAGEQWVGNLGGDQTALAIGGQHDARFIQRLSIPELARHFAVTLIQRLAIVGVYAYAYFIAAAGGDFGKPVGIGQRLASQPDNIRRALGKCPLGLLEMMDAARQHDGRGESGRTNPRSYSRGRIDVAAKGSYGVRKIGGHAFIAAAARVRVGRLADFRVRRILEFPAARQRNEGHAGAAKHSREIRRVLDGAAGFDAVFREHAAADGVVRPDLRPDGPIDLKGQSNSL